MGTSYFIPYTIEDAIAEFGPVEIPTRLPISREVFQPPRWEVVRVSEDDTRFVFNGRVRWGEVDANGDSFFDFSFDSMWDDRPNGTEPELSGARETSPITGREPELSGARRQVFTYPCPYCQETIECVLAAEGVLLVPQTCSGCGRALTVGGAVDQVRISIEELGQGVLSELRVMVTGPAFFSPPHIREMLREYRRVGAPPESVD